jgi:hypothetical protein
MKMKDTLHPLAYASGFLLVFIKLSTFFILTSFMGFFAGKGGISRDWSLTLCEWYLQRKNGFSEDDAESA